MKIAALSATALAALGAAAVATPSFAQDYPGYGYAGGYGYDEPCAARQHEAGTTGAVLGGIAGALLGSSLAPHHGDRAGGAAIGAVAGAVIGNNIGRANANSSDVCEARDYGQVAWRGAPYYAPDAEQYRGDYYRSGYRPYRHQGYDPYRY
jgi:surface antigen